MNSLVRYLVVALMAVFAAWSVVRPAGAMEVAATLQHGDAAARAHCDGCGGGAIEGICDVVCHSICISMMLADPTTPFETSSEPRQLHVASRVHGWIGRTVPPDPYPPRPLLV